MQGWLDGATITTTTFSARCSHDVRVYVRRVRQQSSSDAFHRHTVTNEPTEACPPCRPTKRPHYEVAQVVRGIADCALLHCPCFLDDIAMAAADMHSVVPPTLLLRCRWYRFFRTRRVSSAPARLVVQLCLHKFILIARAEKSVGFEQLAAEPSAFWILN
jgi:hypothetical protein